MYHSEIPADEADAQSDSDADILAVAKRRFLIAAQADTEIRKEAVEDLKFLSGEQWPLEIRNQRNIDNRPCLTINRLPQFVSQITNEQRQSRSAIKVSPTDNQATVETGKVLQGMNRHIEYDSNADVAVDQAFEQAAASGLGWFRIVTDYEDTISFDQEILYKQIPDRFSVYPDPSFREPDGRDMNYCFIGDWIDKDDYKVQYPDSKMASMDDWVTLGDGDPEWVEQHRIRVIEYFYIQNKAIEVALLSNGYASPMDKVDEAGLKVRGITIVKTKRAIVKEVKWCKLNGHEVLEKTDWLGQWIPIIPVIGRQHIIEGKRQFEGIIRQARDSQRMYNYWASAETETIALAPRAPFIGAEGQFEGHEEQWKSANTKNQPYLMYKPSGFAGVPLPPPQRSTAEPAIQAISQARMQSADDIKATTAIYDASLGNKSNEQSGVAIERRNDQAQTSNFHYIDNLRRSRRHAGRIIVDLIPKIYDTARAIRIIGTDDQQEVVMINQMFQKDGKNVHHNLSAGKYDVTIDDGPSYTTKREEAVDSMLDLIKAFPPAASVIGDLLVKNMDWEGAQEVAARLRVMLPPQVQQADGKGQPPLPPQVQQQMQQQGQMIQQLTQHVQDMTEQINAKKVEADAKAKIVQMDLESKERMNALNNQTTLQVELARINSKEAIAELENRISSIQHSMEMIGDHQSIELNAEAGANDGAAQSAQGVEQ